MTPETPAPATTSPCIRTVGLSKRYGGLDAVRQMDLEVGAGEVVTLLGPNGSGKTATLRMLMGILKPTAGSASILGHDCFGERPEVMRHVGYLPDVPLFYDYLTGRIGNSIGGSGATA